jgi:glutathione S-transferase
VKLFFSPGACSLSAHIVLRESGLPFDTERVDLKAKKTAGGNDFITITDKGAVPTLQLDDGQVLTEGSAIVQYIADKKPEAKLAPPAGSLERYRLQEWLNYIAAELHKSFSPLFKKDTPEEYKASLKAALAAKFAWIDGKLAGKQFLLGDHFTVADAYLFTVARWTKGVGPDLSKNAALSGYLERVAARPAVRAALQAEGLS